MPGYVYLIKDLESGLFKLGHTGNVRERAIQLSRGSLVCLVAFIGTNHRIRLETYIKRQWEAWHVRGEWYSLPPERVAEFAAISVLNWHGIMPVPRPSESILERRESTGRYGRPRAYTVRLGEPIRK